VTLPDATLAARYPASGPETGVILAGSVDRPDPGSGEAIAVAARARLATAHVDDRTLERLAEIHARFTAAVDAEDRATTRRTDLEFHPAIQNLSGNAYLIESLERIQTEAILAVYSTVWISRGRQAVLEHTRIQEALIQLDGETAERSATQHLQNLTTRVLAVWKRSETARAEGLRR
jgi:DNA-binding GntR family transcriptional regulator